MAKLRGDYRTLYAAFWDDPDVQADLAPEARLLFACLRTCDDYGVAGIFRTYLEVVAARTGFTAARGWTTGSLLALFADLERAGFIRHDPERGVVWIVDGLRWDPTVSLRNAKQAAAVLGQLRALPQTRLIAEFIAYYGGELRALPEDLAARVRRYANADEKVNADRVSGLFPAHDSVDTERGSSLLLLCSDSAIPFAKQEGPAAAAAVPSGASPAPAPPPRAERDAKREAEAAGHLEALLALVRAGEPASEPVAVLWLDEAERGIAAYYAGRGQLWTPTRRRDWLADLERIARGNPQAVLGALEVYVDRDAGLKCERWLVGIARRMARNLEHAPDDFQAEIATHRQRFPRGALALAAEVCNGD